MAEQLPRCVVAMDGVPRGATLLHDPVLNKGTAFTEAERRALGLEGLLPPQVCTIEQQVVRVLENYRRRDTDLDRYQYLMSLHDRNETLFFRVVVDNLEELTPIIYTPTVGVACQRFGHLYARPRGVFLSLDHRGRMAEVLRNHPYPDVRVIVVTDGERILGLGDQGAGGMGIPIGKLSLYTACAGIPPAMCLPVMLDVGTENLERLQDPLYMGLRRHRLRGEEYDAFVAEFVEAARRLWPKVLIQFEDFANVNAFRLLDAWRERICTFNDDIQGTAAVTLAGLLSALRLTKRPLRDQRILFFGAGEAGIGIADLIVSAMVADGATLGDARHRCWLVDSRGLVVKGRGHLAAHKLRYAHDAPYQPDLIAAIRAIEPTAIVGVSTIQKAFDREVIETMAKINERPIVFALSNPTSKSECTAQEAYTWSDGSAVFASGSPFPPFTHGGKTFVAGQCNNAYVFPGLGLGLVASEARRVTERMFIEAGRALAAQVGPDDLASGRVFPALTRIREVSAHVAAAVATVAFEEEIAGIEPPRDTLALVKECQWEPRYRTYAT